MDAPPGTPLPLDQRPVSGCPHLRGKPIWLLLATIPPVWALGASCDQVPTDSPTPASELLCGVYGLGAWVAGLPGLLRELFTAGWTQLLAVAAVTAVLMVAVRVLRGWWWRRAVAAGYWVRITPPRTVDVAASGGGWRLLVNLARLARLARRGLHLAKPPLGFEIVHTGDSSLTLGLWLPRWVPLRRSPRKRGWCGPVPGWSRPTHPPSPARMVRARVGGWSGTG